MIKLQAWAAKHSAKLILYGVIALGLVGSHTGVYFYGKAVQRTSYERDNVKILKGEAKEREKEQGEFAKEAEKAGNNTAVLDNRLERAIGELNEAIENARRSSLSCDLTDDELRSYQAIRDSYGQGADAVPRGRN